MALMVDRGDSYHVIYLGSCMLSHMSTGLGVLQKPLRDLYFRYRQSGGGPAAQERYLRMSARGMAMTYKESASAAPTEVFYHMPSILFWDAVQYCTVRGSDKKLRGAFEPVDNDHSRNKDNLFSVLEKKYHFLQQMTHPPLFTCVLRRTQGVKALDVHAFVCSSDHEALGLVRSLHAVHAHYKTDETVETGVFGYKPFSAGHPLVGGATDGGGAGGGGVGGGGGTFGTAGSGDLTPDGAAGHGLMGSGSGGGGSMPGTLQQQQPPPRPARPLSLGRRAGGQMQVLPPTAVGQRPQSVRLSSHGLSSSLSSLASTASARPTVYQLTQEDFRRHNAVLYLHDDAADDEFGERRRRGEEQSPDSDDAHHVYQYIRHIDNSPAGTLERGQQRRAGAAPVRALPPQLEPQRSEPVQRNRNSPTTQQQQQHNNNGSIERDTVARSRLMVQETLANQHNSISRNLNHLFSQTQQGSQSHSPQAERTPNRATILGAPFSPTASSPSSPPSRRGGGGTKLGQAHAHSAGGGGRSIPGPDVYDDRMSHRSARHINPPSRTGSRGSVDTESLRTTPQRGTSGPTNRSREDFRSRSTASSHGSPFAARHGTPDGAPRPVAKVTPHKVTGVKATGVQVFPTGSAPVGSLKAAKSPEHRKSPFIDPPGNNKNKAQPRRPKSQYFDEPQYMDESSSSGSSPAKSPPPANNWAFGGRTRDADDSGTGTLGSAQGDGTINEKLLLSKKKDAEIASVLHDLRFDYEGATISPGLPAGNNFEKSLGYFP